MLVAAQKTVTRVADRIANFAGEATGQVPVRIDALAGDASTRRYHRAHFGVGAAPSSIVIMEMPAEARGAAHESDVPFLNVRSFLAAGGLPVPVVYRSDLPEGLIALEDLGDETFERFVSAATRDQRRAAYATAIDLICDLQRVGRERRDERCVAFSRSFDFKLLRWELDHFREWLMEVDRGAQATEAERKLVSDAFDWLAETLANAAPVLVHRDFQSRNLMVRPDSSKAAPALSVIDFQDALLGSQAYDLVALLRDSYVELDAHDVDHLVRHYATRAGISDVVTFRKLFDLQTAQRKLKDAGRFVFIDRVRGNPGFLQWIPTSLRYARDALAAVPELTDARAVLGRYVVELR